MYIDPNTGGVIFGWLLGAFGLITGLLLVFSGRIRGYIAKLRRRTRQKDETEDQE
jgi:hypothetical protein